jgi:hypothetical protein
MAEPYIFRVIPTSGDGSGSVEQGIAIRNGCFAREFGFSAWKKIRVAMRLRLIPQATPVDIPSDNSLAIGFCNGVENIPGTSYINNFAGVGCPGTITYYSSAPAYRIDESYWITATTGSSFKYWSRMDGIGSYSRFWFTHTTASCLLFFVDVERGNTSTEYTGSMYTWFTSDYITGVRPNTTTWFDTGSLVADASTVTPSRTRYSYHSYANSNMLDEAANGEFNAVCVYWGREDATLEILDLYVVRLL